jgi:hypothetical protein
MVLQLANPNGFSKTIIIPIYRLAAGVIPSRAVPQFGSETAPASGGRLIVLCRLGGSGVIWSEAKDPRERRSKRVHGRFLPGAKMPGSSLGSQLFSATCTKSVLL